MRNFRNVFFIIKIVKSFQKMWKKYKRQNYRGGKDGSYSHHLEAGQSSAKAQTCLLGEGS